MKLCNVLLQCNVPPGVETMAVSPAVSVSVIGLIIDALIPAGAGHTARNTAGAKWRGSGGGGREREDQKRKIEMVE